MVALVLHEKFSFYPWRLQEYERFFFHAPAEKNSQPTLSFNAQEVFGYFDFGCDGAAK